MKVVILAGGYGTRISEETHIRPKPMVEIGDTPVLVHIMRIYSHYGFSDFVICAGYRAEYIKQYFLDYIPTHSDFTIDLAQRGEVIIHRRYTEPWKVTIVNTGNHTMTGGRVKQIRPYLNNSPFMLTYGDGLSDINIGKLVEYHQSHGKLVTITAVQPPGRFGVLTLSSEDRVLNFTEKPDDEIGWVNGGFFVMQPEVFDYINDDSTVLERDTLERISNNGQLMAYKHTGFWHPMDTLKDKMHLQKLWESGNAPWKLSV
ncbi:glucose-1-phosphate cytidylyltransferase [Alicyclobacillus tolerans]|uniref:glucose-1-phosphate cytidylyltransferase n=1 Tax=Alicyclobacillus tolerans TaxID=90970 RepID=UPI001F0036B1|nr:glucose-1-phosphate cytidylyltransferase [Alicyclobacillus tolerans]MCF8567633.1 glucose-1-phosphate cytidylyltransferase [Alicyclobacillus tolerans]